MDSYQGQLLDSRYLVEELIGKGGMGVVYRGKHIVVGRDVAIKFLSSEFTTQEDVVTRFYREAQTAAAIGHKNIVDILDVGITERHEPYFVMEFLEGESLSSLMLRTGPLDLQVAVGILEPVLLAAAAAHAKGVVHRDLKPDNVFLVRDIVDDTVTIKLIDFGISKFLNMQESDKLTRAGSALGTPCYMSPEQVSCSFDVDYRSDIYSIGVLLFEMLTGDTPHTGSGHQELMIKILTEPPRNPSDIHPGFPEAARPIIEKAMAVNPIHRYQSATEMLAEIRSLDLYEESHLALSEVARGVKNRQHAVGDLGRTIDPYENTEVPAKVFSSLTENLTPSGWTFPRGRFSRFPAGPKDKLFWIIVGGAMLLVTVGFFAFRGGDSQEVIEQATVPALIQPAEGDRSSGRRAAEDEGTVREARREVRVEIVGTPKRSTIFCNDVLVPSNKFYVPRGDSPVKLTVEAPGYRPFHREVIPSEDLTVEVTMTRQAGKPAATNVGAEYLKGRRQTEIAKDFE